MSVGRFLWGYFRRYALWGVLALGATLLYSASTLLVYGLLQPIFSDVLLTDGDTAIALPGAALEPPAAAPAAAEGGPLPSWVARWRERLDPKTLIQTLLDRLRGWLGVTSDHANVRFLLILFALTIFMRSLAGFANGYFFQIIGLGATTDLRNHLYRRILGQSSRFYAEHPSGELLSRVSNDVAVMQNAVSTRLLDLFQQSVTLVALIAMLLAIHARLAVICLFVAPAILYPIVRFGKGMRRTSHRSQERMADLSNLVSEAVRGHRVVQAFGMERFEARRFETATRGHLAVRLRAQMLTYASGPVVETLAAIGAGFFLLYAGDAIRGGTLRTSEMMQFLGVLLALYDPVRKLNKVNLVVQEALAAADRVKRVMAIPKVIADRPGARRLTALRQAIRFENVTFAYEDESVLKGIDLTVGRGEVVALVGASGAGKSTLVNLLPRFFDPDGGRVTIDGIDLRDVALDSLRALIGLVTQDTVLFNDSVRNNIAYGRADLGLDEVRAAARAAYAADFVELLPEGYDTVIGEGGFKLSGGQRQRLAIARALVKDPPILILDEATSHLDSESEALVQKALYNLMANRTALVIAHRLSTVQRADRIVVLADGAVVEAGNHQQLLAADGAYRRLYDLQFRDDERGDNGWDDEDSDA